MLKQRYVEIRIDVFDDGMVVSVCRMIGSDTVTFEGNIYESYNVPPIINNLN